MAAGPAGGAAADAAVAPLSGQAGYPSVDGAEGRDALGDGLRIPVDGVLPALVEGGAVIHGPGQDRKAGGDHVQSRQQDGQAHEERAIMRLPGLLPGRLRRRTHGWHREWKFRSVTDLRVPGPRGGTGGNRRA